MATGYDTRFKTASRPEVVVLCADDASNDVIAYWLGDAGIPATVAAAGSDAAAAMVPGVTRLLVTDRVLPPWPGLPTFRSLKAVHPGLRVAVLDDGIPDTRIIARVSGADVLLARPLKRAEVLDAARVDGPASVVRAAE